MQPPKAPWILCTLLAALLPVPSFPADVAAAPGRASAPSWKSWILPGPPMLGSEGATLKENLAALPKDQREDAARYIFDTWDVKHYREVYELFDDLDLGWGSLIAQWARKDFEPVFRRAEEWESFHGNELRIALVRQMAERSPLEAARFMRTRLNPMSKQYYYYVTIHGLVPSLTTKPVSEIMPALAAMASGHDSLDEFRWGDAVATLLDGEKKWKSPDLDAEWRFLLAVKPGMLRSLMLNMVFTQRLQTDFAAGLKTDVRAARLTSWQVERVLVNTSPLDEKVALKHLTTADPALMEAWVNALVRKQHPPTWPNWADAVLTLEPKSRRDQILPWFTRMRLIHDEFPTRQWAATLPDPAARSLAEQQVKVSEIVHQATEDWAKACNAARALTEPEARRRALEGVFKAAVHLDQAEAEAQAKTAATSPEDVTPLLDSWTLGRIEAASKEQKRQGELFPLALNLRNPIARQQAVEENAHLGRFVGFHVLREAIQQSGLDAKEKRHLLDEVATDEVDGLLDGFHVPEVEGGTKAALEASLRIEDPDLRFIQQRGIVHDAVMEDVQEAKHQVETANVDPATKAQLMKEWERVSRWYRHER